MASYSARRATNGVMMGLAIAAAGIGLFWLTIILLHLFFVGLTSLNWSTFSEMTPPPGEAGGLLNAIAGTVIMTVIAVAVGAPLGVLAGTFMAEYGRHERLTHVIRFINDILLSAPSIIVGLFIYQMVVVPMGHFSGIAGSMALAIIVLPVVVRTTEDMLLLVPDTLREAGTAVGAPRWIVIRSVAYRAASSGIITGVLLAIARISGETAPLLFTSLNNNFWSLDLGQPMANLPVTIYQFALSPYSDWQDLAWAGALIITLAVLTLSIVARVLGRKRGQG